MDIEKAANCIERELNGLVSEAADWPSDVFESRSVWTERIKDRLCTLGHKFSYQVYADCAGADGSEWGFDLSWVQRAASGQVEDLVLACESELGDFKDGLEDFMKLIFSRATLRVFIFERKQNSSMEEYMNKILIRHLKRFNKNSPNDSYLLCCLYKKREFICKSIRIKEMT